MGGFIGGGPALKAFATFMITGAIDPAYPSKGIVSPAVVTLGRFVIDLTPCGFTLLPSPQIQLVVPGGAPWPYFTNIFAISTTSITVEINDNSSGPVLFAFALWLL